MPTTYADAYYAGWRAYLNGEVVEIRPDGPRRAVQVPAGASRVTFRYEPWSYRLGLFISAFSLLAAATSLRKRR